MALIGYFPVHNGGPCLLGQRTGNALLFAQPPGCPGMFQIWQKYAVRVMRISGGKQADSEFAAGGQDRVSQRDFTVIQYNNCDILEWNPHRLLLLDQQRELVPLQPGRARNNEATPAHAAGPMGQDRYFLAHRR